MREYNVRPIERLQFGLCVDETMNVLYVEKCVYLQPSVVCSRVVIPTQKKMVPISWLVAHWSKPTHIASARRNGTAIVPLKHVK